MKPDGADYEFEVRGYDADFIIVDLTHKSGSSAQLVKMPTSVLAKSSLLDDWASGCLKLPVVPCEYNAKEGKRLQKKVSRIAQRLGKIEKVEGFGLQVVGEPKRQIYVLSEKIMIDLKTGRLCAGADLPRFELEKSVSVVPPNAFDDSVARGAIREWVGYWRARYNNIHLTELVVMIAFAAMCMKREKEKPVLVLTGSSDAGKTTLMGTAAEIFGFARGKEAMMMSVTESALRDRLHCMSGMPIFLDDPKAPEVLSVLKTLIPAIYDGAYCADQKHGPRAAKGFVLVAVNDSRDAKNGKDGPLEKLLASDDSVVNRLILCPVRSIPKEQVVPSTHAKWDGVRPSSTAALIELLRIPLWENGGGEPLFLTVPDQRVQRLLTELHHYAVRVSKLARLSESEFEDVQRFFVQDMTDCARNRQFSKENERKLQTEFMQLLCQRFFREDGALVSIDRRLFRDKPIIQERRKGGYSVRLDGLFDSFEKMINTSPEWKQKVESMKDLETHIKPLLGKNETVKHEGADGHRNTTTTKMWALELVKDEILDTHKRCKKS